MARSLTTVAAQFLANGSVFKASMKNPVLIWKAAPVDVVAGESWKGTHSGAGPSRPNEGEAVVFDVKKEPGKPNAFSMGVTIGRIDTNDIRLDDASVSRFHAWLQEDGKGWLLCDADSKNGTFVDGKRLAANEKAPVKDKAKLKFGEVEVTFLEVDALIAMMEQMIGPSTK
jgi:hypothetical protein